MGMFFAKDNKPFFSPTTSEGDGRELVSTGCSGVPIQVSSSPQELLPNVYNVLGNVKSVVVISRLVSLSRNYVETYSGEFTIRKGGSVLFPSTVKWVEEPDFSKVGYTYQFEIKNGIGRFIKVR